MTWMERLKNKKGHGEGATKPTKPLYGNHHENLESLNQDATKPTKPTKPLVKPPIDFLEKPKQGRYETYETPKNGQKGGFVGFVAYMDKDFQKYSPPQPQPPTPTNLAVAGCSNCEASINQKWAGGGYTMQCVGCMARLVLSARPLRHAQEAMLACNNGRPDRPSRQSVLDWLKAKATRN